MTDPFWRKLTPALAATIVALATTVYAPARSYEQSGECCAQTTSTAVTGKATGCSESLKYQYCEQPDGDNSTLWKIAQVHCCNEVFTSFTENTGQLKDCGDALSPASPAFTALDKPLYVEGVWVRTCGGMYVFTVRRVAG